MRNAGLGEAQTGIKIAGRNINNLRYADDATLMAESEELKSLLMKVKEEWKIWLKAQHSENEDHDIWSHHFKANIWGNSGNSERLYFWGLQITADFDCSHEIKRGLLLGRKVMTNLDNILEEGNGNSLQYSPLQSPMDGGAWWAAVHGVTQGQTWLKQLSSSSSRQHTKKQIHYFAN